MKVVVPGHTYELAVLDAPRGTPAPLVGRLLQFISRAPHEPCPGTTNQEVLRVLIDRVKVLDAELPWHGNAQIIFHLRMALSLHEQRALERKVEKGLEIEKMPVAEDGHLQWLK